MRYGVKSASCFTVSKNIAFSTVDGVAQSGLNDAITVKYWYTEFCHTDLIFLVAALNCLNKH